MHIIIIGGSFGGLNVAFDLRRLLPHKSHKITVIAKEPRFIFIPSLPWVAMGSKTIDGISFMLEGPLKSKGIDFVAAAVERIDAGASQVRTATETYDYDYLVVAHVTPGRPSSKIPARWSLAAHRGRAASDPPTNFCSRPTMH
jgi:sulfide:quinone oxidoreductase